MTTNTAHRKASRFLRLCIGVLASGVWLNASGAQGCTISEPRSGEEVGREIKVTSTAKVAPGEHAWLVARRVDFAPNWWPQGRELEVDAKGKWSGNAALGGPQDVNWKFDIAVLIVTNEGNERLNAYRAKAMETGDWRPIRIQEMAKGQNACQVTVLKTRH